MFTQWSLEHEWFYSLKKWRILGRNSWWIFSTYRTIPRFNAGPTPQWNTYDEKNIYKRGAPPHTLLYCCAVDPDLEKLWCKPSPPPPQKKRKIWKISCFLLGRLLELGTGSPLWRRYTTYFPVWNLLSTLIEQMDPDAIGPYTPHSVVILLLSWY